MPRIVKVRLRGKDADCVLNRIATSTSIYAIETLPRRWWQRTPAKQITIPYPGDDAYRLLQSQVVVRLGAFSNTTARVWTEE